MGMNNEHAEQEDRTRTTTSKKGRRGISARDQDRLGESRSQDQGGGVPGVPGGVAGVRSARMRMDGQRFDLTASANSRQGEAGRLV